MRHECPLNTLQDQETNYLIETHIRDSDPNPKNNRTFCFCILYFAFILAMERFRIVCSWILMIRFVAVCCRVLQYDLMRVWSIWIYRIQTRLSLCVYFTSSPLVVHANTFSVGFNYSIFIQTGLILFNSSHSQFFSNSNYSHSLP